MSATFTKGPWVYSEGVVYVDNGIQPHVARLVRFDGETEDANGCLIAEAPAMFAELRDAIAFMEGVMEERGDSGVSILIKSARAVIARVEGR